jgi:hypothetical protein
MLSALIKWVENKFAGPLGLTGFTNLPTASANARSLIWNKTSTLPQIADDSAAGAWLWIPAYATGTASGNTGTINTRGGKLTTASLTTAAGSSQTVTINSTAIAAADLVLVSLANGTNTQGTVTQGLVTTASGSVSVEIRNTHASAAFNGTVVVTFMVFKA